MRKIKRTLIALSLILTSFIPLAKADNSNAISENEKKVSIMRFDKDLLKCINSSSKSDADALISKYPALLPALAQTITNTSSQDEVLKNLQSYYAHPSLKKIYVDAVGIFDDAYLYNEQLGNMLARAQTELKPMSTPSFAFHVSGFKENTIYINDIVSISIDKYMGSNYAAYKGYFNGFQLQQMTPDMITRDLTKAWLMAEYVKTEVMNGDLLDEMVEHGKLLYALSVLLPNYSESDLIGYTEQQENWCVSNHKKIWDNIVKQNHLYTTDRHVINAYFDDYSSSKVSIKGSPAQVGSWIGFQIVKQYAKSSNSSLKNIINMDAKSILKDAKYRQ